MIEIRKETPQEERIRLEKEIVESAKKGMYYTTIKQAERIIELGRLIVELRR